MTQPNAEPRHVDDPEILEAIEYLLGEFNNDGRLPGWTSIGDRVLQMLGPVTNIPDVVRMVRQHV